jgi:hypothetical protein
MTSLAPSSLDSAALAGRLRDLAGDERNVQVDFLLHLDEFDRRSAFLDAGFGSLWDYCLRALHLREGASFRRPVASASTLNPCWTSRLRQGARRWRRPSPWRCRSPPSRRSPLP